MSKTPNVVKFAVSYFHRYTMEQLDTYYMCKNCAPNESDLVQVIALESSEDNAECQYCNCVRKTK